MSDRDSDDAQSAGGVGSVSAEVPQELASVTAITDTTTSTIQVQKTSDPNNQLRRSERLKNIAQATMKENQALKLSKSLITQLNEQGNFIENFFDDTRHEHISIDALQMFLAQIEQNAQNITAVFNELCSVTNNKTDESIIKLYNQFISDLDLVKQCVVIEQEHSRALKEAKRALEDDIQMCEEKMKRARLKISEQLERSPNKCNLTDSECGEGSGSDTPTLNSQMQPPNLNVMPLSSSHEHSQQQDVRKKSYLERNPIVQLADTLTQNMEKVIKKRNAVEPKIFSGDVLEFNDWEVDLEEYFEAEDITGKSKLRHLRKYVSNEAKKVIDGYLLLNTEAAYEEARIALKERYGNPQEIKRRFIKKVYGWPRVTNNDGKALREYADFLSHIMAGMKTIPALRVLNSEQENEKLVEKIPVWLRRKWAAKVADTEDVEYRYPNLSEFIEFIKREARIMLLPISKSMESKSKEVKTLFTASEIKITPCSLCKMPNHSTDLCYRLIEKPYTNRLAFIKEQRLCYSCLQSNHSAKECQSPVTCKRCNRKHPTVLHKTRQDWNQNAAVERHGPEENGTQRHKDEEEQGRLVQSNTIKGQLSVLSMILPVHISTLSGKETLVYALLDSQSDGSFISKEVASQLQPEYSLEKITISTMNGKTTQKVKQYRDLVIRGYNQTTSTTISPYEQQHIPCERYQIPTSETKVKHLEHIIKQCLSPPLKIPIGLLIGIDCPEALAPLESVIGEPKEPFAVRTMMGWTVCGGGSSRSCQRTVTNYRIDLDTHIIDVLNRDFDDTNLKEDKLVSQDDLAFLRIMDRESTQTSSGYYQMPLPFKSKPILPNNYAQAEKRLESLKRKFDLDPQFKDEYTAFMEEIIQHNQAELVPENEIERVTGWYIPHFAVKHPKKSKIRVVFDCKAKFKGTSLNDTLLQGPDSMNSLVGILLRFRKEKIALCCDIKKMFYNFLVDEHDRDYLRFLWINNNETKTYRMKVHLFGAKSSPAVATYGLRKIADDYSNVSERAAKFLKQDFYVDDGITSVPTVEQAVQLLSETRAICLKGNLQLHKIASNSKQVLLSVPPCETTMESADLSKDRLPSNRTLGMEWCMETDSFRFLNNLTWKPITRRGILSTVAQIYDPMGFLSPFTLEGKAILQEACAAKLDWDDDLGPHLTKQWNRWLGELPGLNDITIDRKIKSDTLGAVNRIELHHFSDASEKGYASSSYLRFIDENSKTYCSFLMGKARVAPLKKITIPRLELQGALTASRVSIVLRRELDMNIHQEYFWTDSEIVLGYLNNTEKKFHTFVANRVQEILSKTDVSQWNHISSQENPADLASRGATLKEMLNSTFRRGPEFLWQPDITNYLQRSQQLPKKVREDDLEIKKAVTSLNTHTTKQSITHCFESFSSWHRLVKAVAHVKLIARHRKWKLNELTSDDLLEAEICVIQAVQSENYDQEIRDLSDREQVSGQSSVLRLSPVLDNNRILRVGGRAKKSMTLSYGEKHPVILPSKSHVSKLLVLHYHNQVFHQGRTSTIGALREAGYWIISSNRVVRSVIQECVLCKKMRKLPSIQKMGLLPQARINPTPPFTHVGLDCFGPYSVKDRRTVLKRWGLIFVCMYSRAVHLEVLEQMTSDAFINALRNFMCIRGPISTIFSDNGTNFIGANNELAQQFNMVYDDNLKQCLQRNKITFKTNPPGASHWGGLWERQIRNIRNVLNGMATTYSGRLDTSALRTAFYEAMATVNSRPIATSDLSDPDEIVLTPNHLITMKSKQVVQLPGRFDNEDVYSRKMWRKVQQFAQEFWRQWKVKYLTTITKFHRWEKTKRNIAVDDIVMIVDEHQPRNEWKCGVVVQVYPGKDNLVRRAKIRLTNKHIDGQGKPLTDSNILERPISKLVLIIQSSNGNH